jgi:hypothetical protein
MFHTNNKPLPAFAALISKATYGEVSIATGRLSLIFVEAVAERSPAALARIHAKHGDRRNPAFCHPGSYD